MKKLSIPKFDGSPELVEIRQSPHNQGQTGGSRVNPDPGVPHFPSNFYPQLTQGRPINPGLGYKKVILIRRINSKKKAPKDLVKKLKNLLGEGIIIDMKWSQVHSKKYPSIKIFATFATVREDRIPELKSFTEENKVPLLILKDPRDRKASSNGISQISSELKLLSLFLES